MDACVICRCEIAPAENWIKCHLWAAFGAFHWRCFAEYLREQSEQKVETAIWLASHNG